MGSSMNEAIFNSKQGIPNKLLQADGSVTDLAGNSVIGAVSAYENKPALPNKWLNPDGTYSTLAEIVTNMIDNDLFIVVDELPVTGESNKIYLLVQNDKIIEYIWINNAWDPVGMIEFDLSNYYTKTEVTQLISTALDAANSHTDSKIVKIFEYKSSLKSAEKLAFWNEVLQANDTAQIIIRYTNSSISNNTKWLCMLVNIGELRSRREVEFYATNVKNQSENSNHTLCTEYRFTIAFQISNGVITDVEEHSASYIAGRYLATDHNYATPYIPLYDGSPATKKYVDDNAVTFKPFPNEFDTSHTTQDFLDSIELLSLPVGMAYLGQVSLSDMPDGVTVQAEVEVYIYPQNVIYCVMRSAEVSPYIWECNSYEYRGWEPIISDAKQQIFIWNGDYGNKTTKPAVIEMFQQAYDVSRSKPVIIIRDSCNYNSQPGHKAIYVMTSKNVKASDGSLSLTPLQTNVDIIVYNNSVTVIPNNAYYSVQLVFEQGTDNVTSISQGSGSGGVSSGQVYNVKLLATDVNYATPYIPLYDGSPATKKYVDDSISTSITQVLGGSY